MFYFHLCSPMSLRKKFASEQKKCGTFFHQTLHRDVKNLAVVQC